MKSPRGLFVAFMRHVRVSGHPRRDCGEHALCSFIVIIQKRAVFALRAEFSSLSFPKEKGTKKKENLRACVPKNPLIVQSCYAQSKTSCLSSPQLRVALRHLSGEKNCMKREEKVGATIVSRVTWYTIDRPRLRRAFPRNTNSDGRALRRRSCREIRISVVEIRFRLALVMLT